jgi:predicted translin family RNA/ssDNA-binding protein
MRKLFLLVALALPLAARAQSKKEAERKVEYEKKTVINFEDDTIQGDLTRPDGEYVEARKRVSHSNLIKIREDWRDKVKQASGDL